MLVSFLKNSNISARHFGSVYNTNVYKNIKPQVDLSENKDVFVKDVNILKVATDELNNIIFDDSDVSKIKRYGAKPIFKSGADALNYAKANKIAVKFSEMPTPDVYAQWVQEENAILINNQYENTRSLADIFAITSAILHELSHAKDKDAFSSIQEEIECLGMNALGFNYFQKKYPYLFNGGTSPIIKDGVELYSNLFLGDDSGALKRRIKLKYGHLPVESPNHSASEFAKSIKTD